MKETLKKNLDKIKGLAENLKNKITNKPAVPVEPVQEDETFLDWIEVYENVDIEEQRKQVKYLKHHPLISILMPVYQVDFGILEASIQSVLDQTYPYFELILADDASENEEFLVYLSGIEQIDDRIKVIFREENGGISEATNTAFKEAKGEFIALMDDDDLLAPYALYEVAKVINEHPKVDMIYSDEDKINLEGERAFPHFKSDFAPDTLLSTNYICHFLVIRRSVIQGETLLNSEFNGSQDYDLVLRVSEKADEIIHIPKLLYHWRMTPGSTSMTHDNKDYADENGRRAVQAALDRRGLKGEAVHTGVAGYYQVNYEILDPEKKVSIIIPTRDNPDDLKNCISTITENTKYPNYEIIIINNNSTLKKTYALFEELKNKVANLSVYDLPIPFNYSRINNFAAEKATGDFYLFLNDDTKVLTGGWVTTMVGYAQQPWIGAVGVKLLYPDNMIQHGGVVIGLLGICGHVFEKEPGDSPGYMSRLRQVTNYSAVTAACMMIEKDKFWQVGGFDESLAVAYNDTDLCLKLVEAGYHNIFLPQVRIIHYESKTRGYETSAAKTVRIEKEKGRIQMRWRDFINHDPMYNPNLTILRGDFSRDI